MEKNIKLVCAYCDTPFEKESKEYRRQLNVGRTSFYCSRSCSCKQINKDNPSIHKGNVNNFKGKHGKSKDEYTSFRWFTRRAKCRSGQKDFDYNLTPIYLKQLFENQNGICPFTGWKLILPIDSGYAWTNKNPQNASIDRIDNSKGYIQGNVRFVSIMANLARQAFTDEQLIEFCNAVTSSYQRS